MTSHSSNRSKNPERYALAPDPIFWSLQGEGHLRGFQMAFLRLAGCSVGCARCDTNYSVGERLDVYDIQRRIMGIRPASVRDTWVWITGGEPTDHNLEPLLAAMKEMGWSTCVATSGSRRMLPPVDWLSVSPHDYRTQQLYGNEVKLVVGLNGLDPWKWIETFPDDRTDFWYRYVQPLTDEHGNETNMDECLAFVRDHPNWSISRQDHVHWGAK